MSVTPKQVLRHVLTYSRLWIVQDLFLYGENHEPRAT
jgi:hypothetical protein